MTIKQQPHRLLEQLDLAHTQQLISYYTVRHAVTDSDYYPKKMLYLQLNADANPTTIDRLCRHIEENFAAAIWNREYTNKSITIAYTNVDYCTA